MKAGIIAAGLGERLCAAGITTPKPLVAVGGRPLIARAIDAARAAGASSVACIINNETTEVRRFLDSHDFGIALEIVQRTTASSAESFLALRPMLEHAPFLLLTVDAVIAPSAVAGLVARGGSLPNATGVLGITATVDDEKPLWVEVDAAKRILAFGDAARARFVTAGVYFLQPVVYSIADVVAPRPWKALRVLLASLLEHGHALYGYDVGTAIDVDRPEDIVAAERLLGVADPT